MGLRRIYSLISRARCRGSLAATTDNGFRERPSAPAELLPA
jgi:hypothetical protein